ncbi:hypothetical protein SCH01S_01_01240 [Sphingomonas changbaiensis NBRC 104936]|uniref:Uncharacterized protein n=1 Tax=Sphingomonas changbaiensis NBRC 104936 TaxID=1219043 RepID=A0A0E9MKM9_9SPHN|nr:hypothetical protein [Sphingomonas changbaiensis]GAO37961.1 hypothetical protein SCH01S_01_01240 [Sphingomonas changbaiensis NBRC 104936]
MTDKRTLSTEHQRPGDAARPDDTMDKNQARTPEDEQSDRGNPAFIARNGEVRGSGAGAGGGNMREDYDDDAVAGGGDLADAPNASVGEEDQIHQAVKNQSTVTPDDYPEKDRAR